MKKGKVKFYADHKGYGWIIEEETKQEFYFHVRNVNNQTRLFINDNVQFELRDAKMKAGTLEAFNIQKIS